MAAHPRRPRGVVAAVGITALLLAACGSEGSNTTGVGVGAGAGCDALAPEAADLVVDLATHAARGDSGVPLAALHAEHPDDVDVWEVVAALAAGSTDLEARVAAVDTARREAGCEAGFAHRAVNRRLREALPGDGNGDSAADERDLEKYTALNILAILAANLAPPPEPSAVPEGFPPEFPVHPEATLESNKLRADRSVVATWTVAGASFDQVSAFYDDRLQELRFGGWNVRSSSGSGGTSGEGDADGSREQLEVEGFGFRGRVTIEADGDGSTTVITADLTPA